MIDLDRLYRTICLGLAVLGLAFGFSYSHAYTKLSTQFHELVRVTESHLLISERCVEMAWDHSGEVISMNVGGRK